MKQQIMQYGITLCLGLSFLPYLQAQTLFKWVDAQGRTTYSDRPAPPDAGIKDVTAGLNTLGAGAAQAGSLSYETQNTVEKYPVTLYAAKGCPPCDEGRALLRKRGVPYSEKLIESESDLKALQDQFGVQTLPLLTVGASASKGFSSVDWDTSLDKANYPKEGKLPKGYATGKVEKLSTPAASGAAALEPSKRTEEAASNITPSPATLLKPNLRF